ncbi:MAG TPA: DMT family transporter [Lacibacter sp.]|nr:DMT family transporter [Lacibacter sp.]
MTTFTTRKAHWAVLAANLLFGINFSVVKIISPGVIQPFALNLVRVIITASLFWLLWLAGPRAGAGIRRADLPRFLLCALTGVAINQLLFIKGLTLTTPIHAALLMLGTPVFILLLAWAFRSEPVRPQKLVGLALAIGGALLLILTRESSAIASNMMLGDVLVLLNAITYSFYFNLVKPLMQRYQPIHIIRWVFTLGFLYMLPVCWPEFAQTNWSTFTLPQLGALAFVVLGATFFAYLFNIYGLQHLSASATGAYIYLQPLFSAIISILFLGEETAVYKAVAAVLIFAGVYLVNRRDQAGGEKVPEG